MRIARRAVPIALAGMGALLLASCRTDESSFLHPQGIVARHQLGWFLYICALMAIVVVPVFVMVPLFAWRYRLRGGKGAYRPNWDFNWWLEGLVWGVPFVIVFFLGALIVDQETRFDPFTPIKADKAPTEIDVIGLNWKFLFLYPAQHVASVGTMAFPADRPITFRLTSDKTLQSFFIPALGSQIYAMAGMVTKLNLMADHPGRFIGENTQFNGMQFQRERFVARGMTTADFDDWVQRARGDARPLDRAAFDRLAKDGNVNNALGWFGADPAAASDPLPRPEPGLQFSDYDPSLFNDVVDHFVSMPMNTPPLVGPPAADTPAGARPAGSSGAALVPAPAPATPSTDRG